MNLKEDKTWTRRQTLKLIDEFKQREILYKVNHPDYFDKNKRKEAVEEIVEALQNVKSNATFENVKRKIKVLRQQIATERKKIKAATRNGMLEEGIYISKLWCFDELQFLLDANDELQQDQSDLAIYKNEDSLHADDSCDSSQPACSEISAEIPKRRRVNRDSWDSSQLADSEINPESSKRFRSYKDPLCENSNAIQENGVLSSATTLLQNVASGNKLIDSDEPFCIYIKSEIAQISDEEIKDELKEDISRLIFEAKRKQRQLKKS